MPPPFHKGGTAGLPPANPPKINLSVCVLGIRHRRAAVTTPPLRPPPSKGGRHTPPARTAAHPGARPSSALTTIFSPLSGSGADAGTRPLPARRKATETSRIGLPRKWGVSRGGAPTARRKRALCACRAALGGDPPLARLWYFLRGKKVQAPVFPEKRHIPTATGFFRKNSSARAE